MAILTNEQRRELWAQWMQRVSNDQESVAVIKSDLRAAVDAIDQWVEDNKASFNQAIPQPARNELTAVQKAELLLFVVQRRFREDA